MRIYHIVGSHEDNGGVLSVIRNIQEASAGWGWHHVVGVNSAYHETRRPALEYQKSPLLLGESPSYLRMLALSTRAFFEFKRDGLHEQFEVLHFHSRGVLPMAWLATKWLKRSVVFTVHALPRQKGLYVWLARNPRFYTVPITHFVARHVGLTPKPPHVHVISSCCSDAYFSEPVTGRRFDWHSGEVLELAAFGNLVRWKMWELVLQAIAALEPAERRRIHFSLWGPTPGDADSIKYEAELRAIVAQHRLEAFVTLPGKAPSVMNLLRETDWLVHPTPGEPGGVAVMEALALGVPALVSARGGPAEIVQSGSGLQFGPDDPLDLARQLRLILKGDVIPAAPEIIRESVRSRSATETARRYGKVYALAAHGISPRL